MGTRTGLQHVQLNQLGEGMHLMSLNQLRRFVYRGLAHKLCVNPEPPEPIELGGAAGGSGVLHNNDVL